MSMTSVIFFLYAIAHLSVVVFTLRIMKRYSAPGTLVIAALSLALIWDNGLVSVGHFIGYGDTLELLSWPRFILHALITPFMVIGIVQVAAAGGIQWLTTSGGKAVVWLLTLALVGYGIYELTIMELQPACYEGTVRYTTSASPIQYCFEGQETLPSIGPPLASIIAVFLFMGFGAVLWKRHGWPWYTLGGLQMLIAAGIPFSLLGMLPANGGEVLLQFAFVSTAYRFSSGWQQGADG